MSETTVITEAEAQRKDTIVINRRSFFGALLALGSAAVGAILAVPVLRFVHYPLYSKAAGTDWSDVGELAEFANAHQPIRKTISFKQRDGWREVESAQSVYVTKASDGSLVLLSAICPHLGCTVSWQQGQDKFVCPCHGGEFAASAFISSAPHHAPWISLPPRSRTASSGSILNTFAPTCPTRKKQLAR